MLQPRKATIDLQKGANYSDKSSKLRASRAEKHEKHLNPMQSLLIKALLNSFAILPLWLSRQFGSLIGSYHIIARSGPYRVTEENIARCYPKMAEEERQLLVQKSLAETGKMATEVAAIWTRPWSWVERKILKVHGEDKLMAAIEAPEGLILLTPHIGNWEILGPYVSQLTDMTALYQPPKLPAMDSFIRESRERMGATLVPTDRRGVSALLKALKKGGLTIILPDQVADGGSQHAPFFGHPAQTMTLVSNLLNRTGAKVLMCLPLRVRGGFEIHVVEPEEAIYSEDLATSLAAMNLSIEKGITLAPAQYQWEYKRFRRPPEGQPKPYVFK